MKKILLSLGLTIISAATVTAQNKKDPASTILTDWMDLHCQLVRKSSGITHVAYSRHFSYTAIAVYESIVKKYSSSRSLAKQLNGLTNFITTIEEDVDQELTVNTTYAEMLRAFYSAYPGCKITIDSMEQAQSDQIGKDVNTINNSKALGRAVAKHILKWANADGAENSKAYIPLKGDGLWAPVTTAAAPFWYENRSITPGLFSIYSMKSPTHSKDSSSTFYKMAKEVYEIGKGLTEERRKIALHWDDSPNGVYITVFGHWTSILSGLIKEQNLSLIRAAEVYAKMTIALHDACLVVWKGKYEYAVVRPETYIQQHIDKSWQPLISTPPHPEFPAAHAALSYTAATILQTIFANNHAFTDSTYSTIGMEKRRYQSLREAATEAGLSRLYGGIHYRNSIEQSFSIGETIALFIDRSLSFQKQ